MMKDNKKIQNNDEKIELAKSIASQSKKVSDSYISLEDNVFRTFKWFSSLVDSIIFNNKYAVFVALGIALILYFSVNYNSDSNIFNKHLNSSKDINGVSVNARYNSESFEISGLPTTCDLTITGDAASVNAAISKKSHCLINLDGYVEGTHTIKLTAVGYGDNVGVKINPSNATITLKKKTTRQFVLGYDFINTDKLDSKFTLNQPTFDNNKVNIRASEETLNAIAFVKALIDVSGVNGDFTQEAVLIAYDKMGKPVNADIVPNTVNVAVKVSFPHKIVPVVLNTTGTVPNNMAVDSIFMDHQTVTIYAPESVLVGVNHVTVNVDASTLSKDTKIIQPIILPNGVSSSDFTKVNLEIKLAEKEKRTLLNIPITVENYDNNLALSIQNKQSSVKVIASGTKSNLENINPEDITVFFDLANVEVGSYDIPLQIAKSPNPFVGLEIEQKSLNITITEKEEGN